MENFLYTFSVPLSSPEKWEKDVWEDKNFCDNAWATFSDLICSSLRLPALQVTVYSLSAKV